MSKRGKVGTSGREIMASLYGSRGRAETNAYADLCAERQQALKDQQRRSLTITHEYHPEAVKQAKPKHLESPRTAAKWARARAVNAKLSSGAV